jgi:hypothetical protein
MVLRDLGNEAEYRTMIAAIGAGREGQHGKPYALPEAGA